MDYLILKNSPLILSIQNRYLRKKLTSHLLVAEQRLNMWIEAYTKVYQRHIDSTQKDIQDCTEMLKKEECAAIHGTLIKDIQESQSNLKDSLAQLRDLNGLKKKAYKSMKQHNQETPSEIRRFIPVETAFDQQITEFLKFEEGATFQADKLNISEFNVSSDMQLDLVTMEDPVSYFYQDILEKDQKKLKVFEPKIVAFDSKTA